MIRPPLRVHRPRPRRKRNSGRSPVDRGVILGEDAPKALRRGWPREGENHVTSIDHGDRVASHRRDNRTATSGAGHAPEEARRGEARQARWLLVFEDSAGFSVGHDADAGVYIRWNRIEGFVEPGTPWVSNWASTGSGRTIVLGNSFLMRPAIAVELPPGYVGADLDARKNYWGTTDTGVIDQMIFDQNDSITSAEIIPYLPILTAPHPDAP